MSPTVKAMLTDVNKDSYDFNSLGHGLRDTPVIKYQLPFPTLCYYKDRVLDLPSKAPRVALSCIPGSLLTAIKGGSQGHFWGPTPMRTHSPAQTHSLNSHPH